VRKRPLIIFNARVPIIKVSACLPPCCVGRPFCRTAVCAAGPAQATCHGLHESALLIILGLG
jgi:hypothetical protein